MGVKKSRGLLWGVLLLLLAGAGIATAVVVGTREGGESAPVVVTAADSGVKAAPAPAPPPTPAATPTATIERAAPAPEDAGARALANLPLGPIDAAVADAAPPAVKPQPSSATPAVDTPPAEASEPAKAEPPPPEPVEVPANPSPGKPSPSLVFDEPRVVGDLDVAPLDGAVDKVRRELEKCRLSTRTEKVLVQLHVAFGDIHLAAPAPDNKGSTSVANCIANRIRGAHPKWPKDQSGILFVEVTVAPRP